MTTPQSSRWRSRVKRAIKWCGGLVALVVVVALVLVHNLDHPWVKRRIQALVAKNAGLDIDYRAVKVSVLSGIVIEDVVVRAPAETRAVAPEFAKIGHIAASWSIGGDPTITSVVIRDVAVNVAVDEKGRTSLDILFPPSPEPSTPLSHKTSGLLGSGLPVGDVSVEHVTLALVKTEKGKEVQRTTLDGVSLEAHAEGTALHARLGDESAPLHLAIDRRGQDAASAHATFSLIADVDPTDAALALNLHVDDQTFVEGARVAQAVHAGVRAHFDPKAGRTDASVQAEIADGAAHAAGADVSVPDTGPPVVRYATGDVDLAKLIEMAPPELVPVTLARAQLRYRVSKLVIDSPPRLDEGGSVTIHGELADVKQRLANGSAHVDSATFDVKALPEDGGMGVHATAKVDAAKLEGATTAEGTGVTLAVDGRVSPEQAISGKVKLGFQAAGGAGASARDGNIELTLHDLVVDPQNALATRGDVALSCDVASFSARTATSRITAETLGVHAHAPLTGHAPYGLDADATTARLQLSDARGRTLADAPAKLTLKVSNATPDLARPIASTATVHATVDFGNATTDLDASKEADAVGYKLHVAVPSLALAKPFVPPDTAAVVPLERMGVKVDSDGRIERIASSLPEIRHHTKIDVDQPGFSSIAAKSLALVIDSNGTAVKHDADIDLRTVALSIAGAGTADDHVTVKASIDRAAPSARVNLVSEGRAAIKLAVGASFDRTRHALAYDVDAKFGKLAPLAPLLASLSGVDGIDVTALDLGFAAKGDLLGVVEDVGGDGTLKLAPTPSASAVALGTVDVHVGGFAYSHGAVEVSVPRIGWHADLGATGGARTLDSKLDVGEAHVAAGAHVLDVTGVADHLVGSVVGDLRNPDADVSQSIKVKTIKQDYAPMYPVGDVALDWAAKRDHRGIVHLNGFKLKNDAGGSELTVAGSLDISGAQRRLALHGNVTQDLARVSKDPAVLDAAGTAALKYRFESGDLVVYRTRMDATLTSATIRLPARNIVVDGANGVVPINLEIAMKPTGVELLRNTQVSPYSMLRFSDQHPLSSRNSFVSIRSITTPWVSIAPLAANLQIDRNIIALGQLEMGIRKGRVTGSCAIDWNGEDSTVDLHVRATGVMSTHDEPFDGNAAVLISARERSIEGRADVLRIGKRHFLDLLDLADPTRTDASMNRVRSGLSLGYPDKVHLQFDHGFASAHIELGGLGSLLSIDDIRGIPIGPLVNRALSNSKGTP